MAKPAAAPTNYFIPSPLLPYMYYDTRFGRHCNIYIAGQIPSHSRENVSINLANGANFPEVKIPFHLSIRPHERVLVRNSWTRGWDKEERHIKQGFTFDFRGFFDIMLSIREDHIAVAINGQQAFTYAHRFSMSAINLLEIRGNVQISSIRFEFF